MKFGSNFTMRVLSAKIASNFNALLARSDGIAKRAIIRLHLAAVHCLARLAMPSRIAHFQRKIKRLGVKRIGQSYQPDFLSPRPAREIVALCLAKETE